MKRCPRCGATKPLSQFHKDVTKASGVVSHCKDCANLQDRSDYAAKAGHPIREWGMPPERVRQKAREKDRMRQRARHGGPDEWARMFAAQAGCCYLCRQPLLQGQDIHVDHDHTCCPSGRETDSCLACRRGLTHAACNQIWGLAGEDPGLLQTIAAEGRRAADDARQRIAAAAQMMQPLWAETECAS